MIASPAQPANSSVAFLRHWDAQQLETEYLSLTGSSAAVMLWNEPTVIEAGPSPGLVVLLASGLIALGEVKFRWRGPVLPKLREIAEIPERTTGRHGWKIVGTRDARAAESIFDHGWASGDQIGLVAGSDERSRYLIRMTDLTGERLQEEEVLIGAIVDGAGMLIAASSSKRLTVVLSTLIATLNCGGFAVQKPAEGTLS